MIYSRRIVLGGLAALTIVGCGGTGHSGVQSSPAGHDPARRGLAVSAPAATTVPKPPPPIPKALVKLRRSLARIALKAGPGTGVVVYDLTKHQMLFTLRGRVRRPPASVEKLYTTLALLQRLSPAATLQTTVLGTGHLGSRGVWHGNLYLRGGGDPSFGDGAFNRTWELGYGPTATQLAVELQTAGIHRITGRVIGDESMFDARRGGPSTDFAPDLPDFGGELSALTYDHGSTLGGARSPGAFAARQLVRTLKALHVRARAAPVTGVTPDRARPLAQVQSPPLSVLLRLMDVPSDDLFAEMLTKQLGARFDRGGSIAAGARVIARTIAQRYRLHPRIVDGSGLSRDDLSSPLEIVDLLRRVWRTPEGNLLLAALPTVGVSGTTRRIAVGTVAAGRCLAKTGTLNYVTNLAGYCHSRGHQGIAFALFIDGPANWQALDYVARMTAAIATY